MAANTQPIFSKAGRFNSVRATAANTKSDGVGTLGTDIFLVFTAGAEGSWLEKVRALVVGTAANTAYTANTLRLFFSTVSTPGGATTTTNTFPIGETPIVGGTADGSAGANSTSYDIAIEDILPAGMNLLVSLSNAPVATTSYAVSAFGGDY